MARIRNGPAWLGTGRAGTGRGGDYTDAPRGGGLAGHGSRAMQVILSYPAGRSVWESRTARGRADRAGRGADGGGQERRAFLRGGAVSAERNAYAAGQSLTSHVPSAKRSRGMFPQGH